MQNMKKKKKKKPNELYQSKNIGKNVNVIWLFRCEQYELTAYSLARYHL